MGVHRGLVPGAHARLEDPYPVVIQHDFVRVRRYLHCISHIPSPPLARVVTPAILLSLVRGPAPGRSQALPTWQHYLKL